MYPLPKGYFFKPTFFEYFFGAKHQESKDASDGIPGPGSSCTHGEDRHNNLFDEVHHAKCQEGVSIL